MATTLKKQPGRVKARKPGAGGNLYIALIDLFATIAAPLPTGTGTAAGDEAIITGNHTFVAATGSSVNGFIKIPLLPTGAGKFSYKNVGDHPAMKVESMFEVFAVGTDAEQVEMLKRLNGQSVIALVEDAECNDPRKVQIGCDCKVVDALKFEFDNESNKMKLSGMAECDIAFYNGTVTLMTP